MYYLIRDFYVFAFFFCCVYVIIFNDVIICFVFCVYFLNCCCVVIDYVIFFFWVWNCYFDFFFVVFRNDVFWYYVYIDLYFGVDIVWYVCC